MPALEIPLDSSVAVFRQSVSLDGTTYILACDWSDRSNSWYADLFLQTETDPDPIRTGMRLALGYPLLVGNVHDSRPPGELMVLDLGGGGDPGREDLGERVKLYYLPALT